MRKYRKACSSLVKKTGASAKIVTNLKGLHKHLQENEQLIINIPGIWENKQQNQSTACDIVLTNQRLLGYYFVSFPRERLFLDALPLSTIRAVTLRQQNFEPVFRELMVKTDDHKVYIRSRRRKIEALNTALHNTIALNVTGATAALTSTTAGQQASQLPTYERQKLHRQIESSPLSITILFTGGLFLELLGILLWSSMQSAQVGAPLLVAGFLSWLAAIFLRKTR